MITNTILGFPRIGHKRELKKALEHFWNNRSEKEFTQAWKHIRAERWQLQKSKGIMEIPVNDFTLYDHILDTSILFSVIPDRFHPLPAEKRYFAMARGTNFHQKKIAAQEMTKWFDTNYHYMVPEFTPQQVFSLNTEKLDEEIAAAKATGVPLRVVVPGPFTFLALGKRNDRGDTLELLPSLLEAYAALLHHLNSLDVTSVQWDEPILAIKEDYPADLIGRSFARLKQAAPQIRVMLALYFADARHLLPLLPQIDCDCIHFDCVRGRYAPEDFLPLTNAHKQISLGLIDGRNIWTADLHTIMAEIDAFKKVLPANRLIIASSCSLLHVPVDRDQEQKLDPTLKSWLAFASQKLEEIHILTQAANEGSETVQNELSRNRQVIDARRKDPRLNKTSVREKMDTIHDDMLHRISPFSVRSQAQQERLQFPMFPTTTIGSFPQTQEIRKARADFRRGTINKEEYHRVIRKNIKEVVDFQDEMGVDLLVHGEAERNDMVEYFGEQLEGFFSTSHGWVQSYGSRCVKPPVIFADVERTHPMTVDWSTYAQSLTSRPMKGMLTGPITILMWSFVRDDISRPEVATQIALAIRDEVQDLEKANIRAIQVDEPAMREGLPLKRKEWDEYLSWATRCFRIATSGVQDHTQIHTHMCYSEFNDIITAIADLDADAISIESSRSDMELLRAFTSFHYPNGIGPGVYDIHSPVIPTTEGMYALLEKALQVLSRSQLWVNPDCGLKTRKWEEVKPSISNMVQAAHRLRQHYEKT